MPERPNAFQVNFNSIMGLIFMILFFVMLFFIARGIFTLLAWAAPVLIVLALIINYRTVLGYLKYLWNLLRRRPLMGILGIVLTGIGFPIVSGFLLGKAVLDKRIQSFQQQMQRHYEGELVDYQEVTEDAEILELEAPPPVEKPRNTYDDFFNNDPDQK